EMAEQEKLLAKKDKSETEELAAQRFKKVELLDERIPLIAGQLPITTIRKDELEDETGTNFFDENGNINPKMEHIFRDHFLNIRESGTVVRKSVNAGGQCITIEANNQILFSINETISTQVEGNEFGSKMINLGASVAVGAVAGAFTGGAGAAATIGAGTLKTASEAAKERAAILMAGAGMGALETGITSGIRDTASVAINNEHYHQSTFYDIQHRYFYGGPYPLWLKLKLNQVFNNQYIRKRKIKGPTFYDYYNTKYLGKYLNAKGDDFYEEELSEIKLKQSEGKRYFAPLNSPEEDIKIKPTDFIPLVGPIRQLIKLREDLFEKIYEILSYSKEELRENEKQLKIKKVYDQLTKKDDTDNITNKGNYSLRMLIKEESEYYLASLSFKLKKEGAKLLEIGNVSKLLQGNTFLPMLNIQGIKPKEFNQSNPNKLKEK
ncbi:17307_t:CDS:2, partial [Racocetra fulgida]